MNSHTFYKIRAILTVLDSRDSNTNELVRISYKNRAILMPLDSRKFHYGGHVALNSREIRIVH